MWKSLFYSLSFVLQVFLCVLHIVGGIVSLSWTCRLDIFRRNASPDFVWRDFRILQYQCTCSDDSALANLTAVKQRG